MKKFFLLLAASLLLTACAQQAQEIPTSQMEKTGISPTSQLKTTANYSPPVGRDHPRQVLWQPSG